MGMAQRDGATWIIGKIDQAVVIVIDTITASGNRVVGLVVIVAAIAARIVEIDEHTRETAEYVGDYDAYALERERQMERIAAIRTVACVIAGT